MILRCFACNMPGQCFYGGIGRDLLHRGHVGAVVSDRAAQTAKSSDCWRGDPVPSADVSKRASCGNSGRIATWGPYLSASP